tara:strand:+ start:56 stop:397 length:342 start_codon:yes stop_codon:yes gene_type:complete
MALIVGGTTVTGTQTLDATKLTGNLPAINGSSLTNLASPSSIVYASGAVGTFASCKSNYPRGMGVLSSTNIGGSLVHSCHRNNSGATCSGTWMAQSEGESGQNGNVGVWHRVS